MQGDPLAIEILKRHDRIKKRRAIMESVWRDIALKVMPSEEVFFHGHGLGAGHTIKLARETVGVRHDQQQFDSYPTQALEKYAAALHQYTMPQTEKWHILKPRDRRLSNDRYVQRYLEDYNELLFETYRSGSSLFYANTHACFMSNGLYGLGYLLIEDMLSKGIKYINVHVSQVWPVENAFGEIDGVHREYTLTAEQAFKKWPNTPLPKVITDALSKRETWDKEFNFLHCVKPNDNQQKGRRDYAGMPYIAYEICIESKTIIDRKGYRSFPYAITRHITMPGQVYSLSPAFMCLADIKSLNEMLKQNLRYAQIKNYPPIMLADVDSLRPFALRPGFLNYGYLNEDGKPTAVPFDVQGDPRFGIELMEQKRQAIASSFYNTLFDILVQTPEMTATQALIRTQEKGTLLAPVVNRQTAEFLNVIVVRTAQILEEAGVAPQPPDSLVESGGGVSIEYDSPLTRAQKAEGGAGIIRTAEAAAQFQAFAPNVVHRFDYDKALQHLAMIYSAPADVIRSNEEYAALVQQEQAKIATLEQADMALGATQGIKNLAQSQAALTRNQPTAV